MLGFVIQSSIDTYIIHTAHGSLCLNVFSFMREVFMK